MEAEAFDAVGEDPVVTARWQESRSAELQEQARDAALSEDWERVDQLVAQARVDAGDNEWAQGALAALQGIAQSRDRMIFRKEAAFKSTRMRERLYDPSEDASYSAAQEGKKAAFLRRKALEGKKFEE